MAIKKTHDIFIEEMKLKHPDLKILGTYINSQTKILLEDGFHIQYLFRPNDLLKGSKPSISSAIDKPTAFKTKAEQIHGKDIYDYTKINYVTNRDKIEISCNKCKLVFFQRPTRHLSGDGCPDCGFIKSQTSNKQILSLRAISVVNDISNLHSNRVNCDKLDYKGNKIKSLFGCNVNSEHGYWLATPNDILDGCGCPSCNSSKGELEIESILRSKNIIYTKNKAFAGCKYKNLLKFDFYLPDYNLCIEYDGIQHFKSISTFGGDKVFKENKIRDQIKNKFCKTNKIKLLRIPYTKFKSIENIISNFVF
jgi:Zn finger protein HypA/HybF involved in hydrogenase expression